MRYLSLFFICAASALVCTCSNLEDAPISSRNTFLKIYEGPYSITATDLEILSDGFAILGNMRVADDSIVTVVFKTDKEGNRISDYAYFGGGTGKSFKHFSTGAGGYIIVGDSIKSDLSSTIVANIVVVSARILVLDDNLENPESLSFADTTVHDVNPYIADYFGESVTVDEQDGHIVILGTYREGVVDQVQVPLKPFVLSLKPDFTRDWVRHYNLINYNYGNSRSVHYYNNKIYWASSIERFQDDLTFSYISIPVVKNESVFVSNDLLGETSNQFFYPADIQPSKEPAFGFGVVGTYSLAADGSQGNIFFLKTDASGKIIPTSIKYFDGIGSAKGTPVSNNESQIVDAGEAIASTSDGGFILAGTYESNPQLGKGAKDIFLIRLDITGNTVWVKTFGGSGNEEVVSIVQTSDKGFLICGTSTIGTYATPMLIKIDKNGELKN